MNAGLAWERKLKKMGIPMQKTPKSMRPRSKYNAQPTVVDGVRFDSKKEAHRYRELKLLDKAGKIFALELQPRYPLHPWSVKDFWVPAIGDYVADFRYTDCGGTVRVEDVKGYRTPLYLWKKRHCELQYGITIDEL